MARKKDHGVDVPRLANAVRTSRRTLQGFMEARYFAISQLAGPNWGGEGNRDDLREPVNLLSLFCRSITRKLVARSPRVMLATFQPEARAAVSKMQTWANKKFEALGVVSTFQRSVMDAVLSLGIVKVGLADPGMAAMSGWGIVAGDPFARTISLDDFVVDRGAHDWSEVAFIGHRYRMPLKVARALEVFDPKVRKELKAIYRRITTEMGTERADSLGPGTLGLTEEYLDYTEFWEIYLPMDRLVVTLVSDDSGLPLGASEPIRVQNWIGPDHGPYHTCFFDVVPDNIMPKAMAADLIDTNWMVNQGYRKLFDQTERMKEVTFVRGQADADGNRLIAAADGDVVRCDDPAGITTVTTGGANQNLVAAVQHFKDMFSYLAGNMDMWSGLGPQSRTATQDKMLAESASQMVADMQASAVAHVRSVSRAMCWYWWHHPKVTMKYAEQLPHLPDDFIQRTLTPQERAKIAWDDLEFSVNPFSLQPSTPQSQAAALSQIITQEVIPMMPLLQQQGVQFDIQKYLGKRAAYLDLPELAEIVTIGDPPEASPSSAPGGGDAKPGKAPVTTRNYNRYGTGGDSPQGRANANQGMFKSPQTGRQQAQPA